MIFYLEHHTIPDESLRPECVGVTPVLLVPVEAVQVHLDEAASGDCPIANLFFTNPNFNRIMIYKSRN